MKKFLNYMNAPASFTRTEKYFIMAMIILSIFDDAIKHYGGM